MFSILFRKKAILSLMLSLFILGADSAHAQVQCTLRGASQPTTISRLTFHPNVLISPSPGRMNGYIRYLPADYNTPGNTREYGLIMFFGGLSAMGTGANNSQLCNIIVDSWQTILGIAEGQVPGKQLPDSILNNFIIIAPQYASYNYDSLNPTFPAARNVEDAINWAEANFRVNSDAIVLTGLSSGANMIVDYGSSSLERAQRVASISSISTCAQNGRFPSAQDAYLNLAQSGTPTWFVACTIDESCNYLVHSQRWVELINSSNPVVPARYSLFTTTGQCVSTRNHNAWNYFYDPGNTFEGGGNFYSWLLSTAALPVKLKSYEVRLVKERVLVNWTTANETNNASFTIERAGEDQKFSVIGTVTGNGNSSSDISYSFTDNNPLSGISYYRLVQSDIDGKQTRFEIKRIIHSGTTGKKLIVSPNPFGDNLTAFVSISSNQKVSVYITDMGGRKLISQTAVYSEGSREIRLNTSSLPRGMYFLRIEGENFNEVQKIIRR